MISSCWQCFLSTVKLKICRIVKIKEILLKIFQNKIVLNPGSKIELISSVIWITSDQDQWQWLQMKQKYYTFPATRFKTFGILYFNLPSSEIQPLPLKAVIEVCNYHSYYMYVYMQLHCITLYHMCVVCNCQCKLYSYTNCNM